jgi:hypothetical protein
VVERGAMARPPDNLAGSVGAFAWLDVSTLLDADGTVFRLAFTGSVVDAAVKVLALVQAVRPGQHHQALA